MLLRSCGPGTRNDYSNLNIDDALPLISHACKTGFGDLTALEFAIKSSQGPLAYSAVLTVTGPDEIGIEFPDSGKHATQLQAKMHAAYKAILGGAIGYIMQSARPTTPEFNEPAVHVPKSPKLDPDLVPQSAPDAAKGVVPSLKPGKKARGNKSKATPDALNLINTYLQRVYRDHKKPMPKSSQEWQVVFFGGGVAARLTIRLPSGSSRSYGDLPGKSLEPGKNLQIYPTATAAKKDVASEALRAGVLQFIKFDKPSGTSLPQPPSPTAATTAASAHAPLSSYVAYDPSKAARTTGASTIPVAGIPSTSTSRLPRPSISMPVADGKRRSPVQDVGPVPPLEQVIDPVEILSSRDTFPRPNRSPSPVDEVEAVDELLGPASPSNPESSEREEEDVDQVDQAKGMEYAEGAEDAEDVEDADNVEEVEEVDELNSSECGDERPPSEVRSEPMELDSETETPPKEIAIARSENRVSPLRDDPEPEPEPIGEPPRKRQRTESPESPIQKVNQEPEPQEFKVMLGTSFSGILSDYCLERGLAQSQVTYQRVFKQPKAEGPVMYSVSIVVGRSRFELSKQYESIELAEEKLSKRILRQFGVRAKKL